jgi:purine-nucleoside phosphorylase
MWRKIVMETYVYRQYQESADALRQRLGDFVPQVLLILGSGLGALGDEVEDPIVVPYGEVPHLKRSTAPDHKGQFVFGRLAGQDVAVMQGRLHTYEGWSFADVSYPVRVLRLLGAETLIVTNAAGAVNTSFSAGDIMLITDHIKFFGVSPLCGPNIDEFGPRFPDVSAVYTPALRETARQAARDLDIPLREGVYMYFPGPQFETPAEVRAARLLGADAVGMSTVPEAIVAAHCGMKVLGFTLCTNMAAGVLDQPLSGDEVIAAGQAAGPKFVALVKACLGKVGS